MKWPTYKLGRLCSLVTKGTTPRTLGKEYVSTGIPFLRAENLQGDEIVLNNKTLFIDENTNKLLSRSIIFPDDVLISIAGTIGRCAIVPSDAQTMNCNQAVAIARISGPLERRYLLHWLKTSDAQMQMIGSRVTQTISNLSLTQIKNLKVPLPPISEQRRIVEILDKTDRLRKLRTDADVKTQRILPVLFIKMFGDPSTNPKGWEQKSLAQTGSKVRYGLGQPPEKASDGVPLIRATNIKQGFISKENMIYVNPNSVPSTRNAFLGSNEVLVVRSGAYTGDVAQVTKAWKGSVVGYDLVITPSDELRTEFIESYLLTPYIQKNYFAAHKSRAGQPHLNANQLENTPFYIPLKERQDDYKNMVEGVRKLHAKRENSEEQIQKIFQVILHRAFTGDLTSSWRKAHIKELLQEMELQAKALAS